ncbi:ABC transporter substrate-binding protein, partial [Desulfobacterales bacterium HSG17]|nr:ABC transporter substrate-binding protein [Desulfobacterales bacterium HSG17]
MKKIFIILFILINAGVYLFWYSPYSLVKEPIRIAVVGPMGLPDGKDMRHGVELYKEQFNRQSGINGRKLELLFYDDNNDPEKAKKIALEIAGSNNVLLVLGHFTSDASNAAGIIYKRNEIPAITASATAEAVIVGNEWYFRTVPDNVMQARFVANYINKAMKKNTASIIYTKDLYGTSLYENFQKAVKNLGMKMAGKWEWDTKKKPEDQLEIIKQEMKAVEDPGILFFATHSSEGTKIITTLKDAGLSLPTIVSDSFVGTFMNDLKPYAMEWSNPGYYSDDIYFVSLFMMHLGGKGTFEFDNAFYEKYHEDPNEMNLCYYDALHVVAEAIKKIEVHGKLQIREDRRKIREILAGFYNEDTSVKGITGSLFFDKNGGVKRHLAVGVWKEQKALPAFSQFQQNTNDIDNMMQTVLDGGIILAEDVVMSRTQVVYVNSDIIQVSDVDMDKFEFTADFHLQFRYSGDFDDTNIEFDNAVSPVVLGNPVKEETVDGITTRAYRIKARFKAEIDFHDYPFDSYHRLPIRFHNKHFNNAELIYTPENLYNYIKSPGKLSDKWNVTFVQCNQDVVSKHIFSYARFNTSIEVIRKNRVILIFIKFVPVILMILALYLIYFIPSKQLRTRLKIIMITMSVNTVFYLKYLSDMTLGYMTKM